MTVSSVLFGDPIYSDVSGLYTPTFTGGIGSWAAGLPLTNLQDRRLARVARSSDALAASTKFEINLGRAAAIRVIALPSHNLSSAATVRVRGGASSGSYTYDSGTITVWPAGLDADQLAHMNIGFVVVPTAAQTYRYWLFEVVDTGNAAGYVELGRVVLAGGYQPSLNMIYGAKLGWSSSTTAEETDGGAMLYNEKRRRREAAFTISELPDSEAFATVFDIQGRLGTSGQFFWVGDLTDTTLMFRRSFLAVMRELSPLEYANYNANTAAFGVREEL